MVSVHRHSHIRRAWLLWQGCGRGLLLVICIAVVCSFESGHALPQEAVSHLQQDLDAPGNYSMSTHGRRRQLQSSGSTSSGSTSSGSTSSRRRSYVSSPSALHLLDCLADTGSQSGANWSSIVHRSTTVVVVPVHRSKGKNCPWKCVGHTSCVRRSPKGAVWFGSQTSCPLTAAYCARM